MLRFPGLWRLRNAAVTVHPRAREDPSMARRTDDLRLAVGAALRRLRNQGHFSLDDIQRGTSEHGVRVTRSHLSRVETGQAELSLPRYLALVRVLGEPAGEVTESLAALVDGALEPGGPGDDLVDGGPGEDDCGGEPATGCEVIALAPGATGAPVLLLQQALTARLFYRGPIDGTYGQQTEFAAVAFHKAAGRPRTTDWVYSDWAALGRFVSDIPDRPDEPDRIEVDVTRQILTLVEAGHVTAIIPVSTASGEPYVTYTGAVVYSHTPRGDFHLTHHGIGWQCSYIGCIYYPWFFTPHYAIHGYPNVPPWPASHGCVRVPVWESDWLEGHLAVGMAMHIWD